MFDTTVNAALIELGKIRTDYLLVFDDTCIALDEILTAFTLEARSNQCTRSFVDLGEVLSLAAAPAPAAAAVAGQEQEDRLPAAGATTATPISPPDTSSTNGAAGGGAGVWCSDAAVA
ncbi:unnamed protein product, partial [Laminaria digitata]